MISLLVRVVKEHWRLFVVGSVFFILWGSAELAKTKLRTAERKLHSTEYQLEVVKNANKSLIDQLIVERTKVAEMQKFKEQQEQSVINDSEEIKKELRNEDCSRTPIPDRVLIKLRN